MDLTYAICIFIFVSSDYVFGGSIEDTGEQHVDEAMLETESGENKHTSAGEYEDGTKEFRSAAEDINTSLGDNSASTNIESEWEESEETESDKDLDEAHTVPGKKIVIYQWRNGIVPYYIDGQCYDDVISRRIRKAMDAIQRASCIVFRQISYAKIQDNVYGHSFVHFTNPNKERECLHTLSTGDHGEPILVLGYDCMQERDIIHSLMHLLGFRDEVTHPHRDSYVRIMWDNIQPKYRHLFTINNKPTWTHKLAEYDTMSIMHFHDRAFSINGGPTILPSTPDQVINPSDKLSLLDKMKLRLTFENECNRRKVDNLLETCKNYARDDDKGAEETTKDKCNLDKFKVTTSGNNGNVGGYGSSSGKGEVPKVDGNVVQSSSSTIRPLFFIGNVEYPEIDIDESSYSNQIEDLKGQDRLRKKMSFRM